MNFLLRFSLLFLLVFNGAGVAVSRADTLKTNEAPQIAVWNPIAGTSETRFTLDTAQLDHVAEWLQGAGIQVSRLTSEQISQPDTLTAQKFEALVLPGETFPLANVPALRNFADQGGVLIALSANVPFLIAIETNPDGTWTMAPKTPAFAWQKPDVMNLYGLKYTFKPELHDSGVYHEPSPLLKKYLPGATIIERPLPSRWIYPADGAEFYPLLESKRGDGSDVTPQIYIAKKGTHLALVMGSNFATDGVTGWSAPRDVVVAMARLATDLKRGKAQLDPATRLTNLDKLSLPLPLQDRVATATTEPEGAKAWMRWGNFNGSGLDLQPAGSQGTLTRALAPGASVQLLLPTAKIPADQPLFLRVRGAFSASGAGLKLEWKSPAGSRTLWNEIFTYIDARGAGNFNAGMSGLATEWTRLMYVPPAAAPQSLVVTNPGTQPVYFDALQLETRTQPTPERILGLGAGAQSINRNTSQGWTNLRVNPRPQYVGPPDDPKRWDKMDGTMKAAYAANPHIQIVLEGTPEWAAISSERMELGKKAGRPHTVPPDPQKYAAWLEEFIGRYGDKVDSYEIWNEPDIQQFWRGTNAEYVALYNALVPVVRRLDPTAQVITAGMSGFKDPWVGDLVAANVPARADLFAFHPYAGKSAGWDTGYGLVQGALRSRGQNIEVYCDESGFVSRNGEWFQPPPNYTPALQAHMLDIAMARVLATDLAKLSIFNAGGDGNPYGLFDNRGQPLPAYGVFADYLPLAQNGGRRLDVSLANADGSPLQGVYTAAASHPDGSATVVVNPVENESLQPPANPSTDFDNTSGWTAFFGKAQAKDGLVTATPDAGKPYVGFYSAISVDTARLPLMEVKVPQSDGGYDMIFKLAGGRQIPVVTKGAAGTWSGDLRKLLPAGTKDFELSFRVYGPTVFDSIHFSPDGPATPLTPLSVRLVVPLAGQGNYDIQAQSGDQSVPVKSQIVAQKGLHWAEITLPVAARTRVELKATH